MDFASGDSFMLAAFLITLWSLPWKGWALWLAARRGEKVWFIALLILNTLAILEIIYIFLIAKRSDEPASETPNTVDSHDSDYILPGHRE